MGDSMSTIINATTTNGVVIQPDNSGSLVLQTNSGTTALTIDTSQNVGIGTTTPTQKLEVIGNINVTADSFYKIGSGTDRYIQYRTGNSDILYSFASGYFYRQDIGNSNHSWWTANTERMRIDSSGNVLVGKSSASGAVAGVQLEPSGLTTLVRSGGVVLQINRLTNDGNLIDFYQDTALEGNISVSGSTVSYNGGHLSRWSQWQNETGKPNVYRGSVLESVDAMCEWEKDGQPLLNEQATKTIVSTTLASKAVAGVFDRYDEDDEDNPYDFYVAQSGDFVIRIAQGVTVQNGDLLESAGDGTAKPQTDDICRSSTIAKVTSNYVSATYEDGSYCVPCILMIG